MDTKDTNQEFRERVVTINRVTKVVKGGRRFSFSALVVAGDGQGQVGVGSGKAVEVSESINKATRLAKKSFMQVPLKDKRTIPYEVVGKFGSSQVVLRPASPGTGVIAGGPVRAVLECIGVKDILTKRLGSRNPHNVVNAALQGLKQLVLLEKNSVKQGNGSVSLTKGKPVSSDRSHASSKKNVGKNRS